MNFAALDQTEIPTRIAHPPALRVRPSPEVICALTARLGASASGVPAAEVAATTRISVRASAARQIGIYLAHTSFGLPLSVVAQQFGRDRTTAAYACRLIEERRDDRVFDAEIAELENLLRAMFFAPRGVA